jgi:hypothetical protein
MRFGGGANGRRLLPLHSTLKIGFVGQPPEAPRRRRSGGIEGHSLLPGFVAEQGVAVDARAAHWGLVRWKGETHATSYSVF